MVVKLISIQKAMLMPLNSGQALLCQFKAHALFVAYPLFQLIHRTFFHCNKFRTFVVTHVFGWPWVPDGEILFCMVTFQKLPIFLHKLVQRQPSLLRNWSKFITTQKFVCLVRSISHTTFSRGLSLPTRKRGSIFFLGNFANVKLKSQKITSQISETPAATTRYSESNVCLLRSIISHNLYQQALTRFKYICQGWSVQVKKNFM